MCGIVFSLFFAFMNYGIPVVNSAGKPIPKRTYITPRVYNETTAAAPLPLRTYINTATTSRKSYGLPTPLRTYFLTDSVTGNISMESLDKKQRDYFDSTNTTSMVYYDHVANTLYMRMLISAGSFVTVYVDVFDVTPRTVERFSKRFPSGLEVPRFNSDMMILRKVLDEYSNNPLLTNGLNTAITDNAVLTRHFIDATLPFMEYSDMKKLVLSRDWGDKLVVDFLTSLQVSETQYVNLGDKLLRGEWIKYRFDQVVTALIPHVNDLSIHWNKSYKSYLLKINNIRLIANGDFMFDLRKMKDMFDKDLQYVCEGNDLRGRTFCALVDKLTRNIPSYEALITYFDQSIRERFRRSSDSSDDSITILELP